MDNNVMHTTRTINKKKQIAILGGAYDPPTITHIKIACEIYNTFRDIEEVWIVPCGDGHTDKSLKASAVHRCKMLQLIRDELIDSSVPIYINETEVLKGEFIHTYTLIHMFNEKYPDKEFILCLGINLLMKIGQWFEYQKLLDEYRCIIIPRMEMPLKDDIPNALYPKDYEVLNTIVHGSSSKIRERLCSLRSIKQNNIDNKNNNKVYLGINGLTTQKVIQYIQDNQLYCSDT